MLEQVAEKYYLQGYNCAESLFLAGNEYYQLGYDVDAVRLFAGFGGGFQLGDVCGALSGAVAVLSAKYVDTKAHDFEHTKAYTQRLVREFQNLAGARACAQVKPLLYSKEVKCLNTVKVGAKALENVIREIENA